MIPEEDLREGRRQARIWGGPGLDANSFAAGYALGSQRKPARRADALAQWKREREALVQCARALAFSYAGSARPDESRPEERAVWDAMHAAYNALGVHDTRDLEATS